MAKASHEEVAYRDGDPNGEYCAACAHYKPPHCELVVDPIMPEGVCDLYEPIDMNETAKDAIRRGLMSNDAYQKARTGGY